MSDGLFNQAGAVETIRQAGFVREKILIVSTTVTAALPVSGPNDQKIAASTCASMAPNDTTQGALEQLGPHFVMSPKPPGAPVSYGFEVSFHSQGLPAAAAVANAGGFTVTVWKLISNYQIQNLPAAYRQVWASFAPLTGVNYNELYHSFDVDACALRFQFGNILTHGLIAISFSEL